MSLALAPCEGIGHGRAEFSVPRKTDSVPATSRDAACPNETSFSTFIHRLFYQSHQPHTAILHRIAMIFQGGRSVVRLPKLTLQGLGNRRSLLSSSRTERVPALYNVFQSQHYSDFALNPSLITPILRRTYAQRAVSRPKAHTGRTTTAARKAPTTSKTKAAKKPAPTKTTPKAVPKAKLKPKPRIKPKPKPAKKKKAKAKPKPKKVLTEAQKSALTKKQLKETALKPPRRGNSSTWNVFSAEKIRADKPATRDSFTEVVKEASAEYRQLTPELLEVCLAY